jgi:protein-tyrosine phosphatase
LVASKIEPRSLYWIPGCPAGNLAITRAPRSFEDMERAILSWKADGVDVVISLLEEQEFPGLIDEERGCCQEFGLDFISFPWPDRSVPASSQIFQTFCTRITRELQDGRSVAIHCWAGIGRSAVLAAGVLIHLGAEPNTALDMIVAGRGREVPDTEAQRQWILAYAPRGTH